MITKGKNKTHKFCTKCLELKPVSEFHRSNAMYDGLQSYCKSCYQKGGLTIKGKRYYGLHKRPFPIDGNCEICGKELEEYGYHHFDDNNLDLGFWLCFSCDYLAEGLDEIDRNFGKVDVYHRLKKKVEEVEKTYVYLGPYSPSNNIYALFFNGEQTHKWCSHCGRMKKVTEFNKRRSNHDGLVEWCRECCQAYSMSYGNETFLGLHKRPNPNFCEFCGDGKTHLGYHHWDDSNRSKGVWVCQVNKCHNLAEAVDLIDNGSLLPDKYSKLKQILVEREKIIIKEAN